KADEAAGQPVEVGDEGRAVVGHDPLNSHTEGAEPAQRTDQEAGGGASPLVGEDFGVGQAGGVVDQHVHVLVDDATRLAYAEVLADERARTATGFLIRALRWFRSFGVAVERVMTDNGSAFISNLYGLACRLVGL